MLALLAVLLTSPASATAGPSADLPDPEVYLHYSEWGSMITVDEPAGWKIQKAERTFLHVRWPSDEVHLAVNRRYLTRKGAPFSMVGERVHVEGDIKMCRRDLCRTTHISVSGQADPNGWGTTLLLPGDWEPPEPPSLDAPDPTGESAAIGEAISAAHARGRIPLLYFWSDGCPPCDRLKRALAKHPPDVYSDRYALIPIDLGRRHLRRWGVAYGSAGTPTLVAVAPDGTPIDRYVGFNKGIADVREFLESVAAEQARAHGPGSRLTSP